MIQLTRTGPKLEASPDDLQRLREEFDRQHCILLPQIIAPDLLTWVLGRLEQEKFDPYIHGEGIGVDSDLKDPICINLLTVLANDHRLFDFVRQITGCPAIGSFIGRCYRMLPNAGHYDSWHDDVADHRMIAMSLNLSPKPYSGGVLQIRDRESRKQILREVANTGLGNAILFRVSKKLQHQLTEVTGSVPKTAFVGWFRSEPDFRTLLLPAHLAATAAPNS